MRIAEMNWMQVRDHAAKDDRAVLPIGSTEQHALFEPLRSTSILSERVAVEAAEPLGIPVFPVIAYGLTPSFVEYPGTVTLSMSTMCALVTDVLDGIVRSGFRRILIVNGHGGNIAGARRRARMARPQSRLPGASGTTGGTRRRPGPRRWRSIRSPRTRRGWRIFPGRGCAGVAMPAEQKPMMDLGALRPARPRGEEGSCSATAITAASISAATRTCWRCGSVAVEETRALMRDGWA